MRYRVTLSYDGSSFSGWQVQAGVPTVQSCLEHALSTLLGAPVCVTGAGRTDTGVNAIGYVAHFDIPCGAGEAGDDGSHNHHGADIKDVGSPDPALLAYKLNAILPPSVVVHSVTPADGDFHARFSASQRKYTYFLHRLKDPFAEKYSLRRDWDLDFEAMNRAAALLVGRHDFACFEKTGTDVKTTVCTVTEAFWAPYVPTHVSLMGFESAAPGPVRAAGELPGAGMNPAGEGSPQTQGGRDLPCPAGWRYMYFRISADRFLRNMVRAIVGTLLEVGRGKRTVGEFATLILPAAAVSGDDRTKSAKSVRSEAVSGEERTKTAGSVRAGNTTGSLRSLAGDSVPGYALFFSGAEYDGQHLTH